MNKSVFFGALSGAVLVGAVAGAYQWYTTSSQAALGLRLGSSEQSAKGSRIAAGAIRVQVQNTATDGGVAENYQDWTVLCQPPADGTQRCLIAQEITLTENGQRIVLLSVERDSASDQLRAGMVVTLNGRLQNRIGLTVEGEQIAQAGFADCNQTSCRAILQLPIEAIDMMKRGMQGSVDLATEAGEPVTLPISLAGFTASWNRMAQIGG